MSLINEKHLSSPSIPILIPEKKSRAPQQTNKIWFDKPPFKNEQVEENFFLQ